MFFFNLKCVTQLMEEYNGPLSCCVEGWKEVPVLTLRETAKKQAPWNSFIDNICWCTSGCKIKKCCCFKQGISLCLLEQIV